MKAQLKLDKALRFEGTDSKGHQTFFDTSVEGGGLGTAAGPMDTALEAAAACSAMDIIPILHKKRKTVEGFTVDLTAERAETPPRVFTAIEMDFRLVSADATAKDLASAVELSHTKYCSVTIMLARSGCKVSWKSTVVNSQTGLTETITSQEWRQQSLVKG